MKKIFFTLSILFSFSSWALVKPYASFFLNQDLSNGVTAEAAFVLFEDGSFSFENNSGGWRFCSSSEGGRYTGNLIPTHFDSVKKSLSTLQTKCLESEGCSKSYNENIASKPYTIELQGSPTIDRFYLSAPFFNKLFALFDEDGFFKQLQVSFGLKLIFAKGKLKLNSLGPEKIQVKVLAPLKVRGDNGDIQLFELKKESFVVTSKGVFLNFKKPLPVKKRYILSLAVNDSNRGPQIMHLCLIDK